MSMNQRQAFFNGLLSLPARKETKTYTGHIENPAYLISLYHFRHISNIISRTNKNHISLQNKIAWYTVITPLSHITYIFNIRSNLTDIYFILHKTKQKINLQTENVSKVQKSSKKSMST